MSDPDILRRLARLEAIAEHQSDLYKAVLPKLGELEQELRLHAAALDRLTEAAPPADVHPSTFALQLRILCEAMQGWSDGTMTRDLTTCEVVLRRINAARRAPP